MDKISIFFISKCHFCSHKNGNLLHGNVNIMYGKKVKYLQNNRNNSQEFFCGGKLFSLI